MNTINVLSICNCVQLMIEMAYEKSVSCLGRIKNILGATSAVLVLYATAFTRMSNFQRRVLKLKYKA